MRIGTLAALGVWTIVPWAQSPSYAQTQGPDQGTSPPGLPISTGAFPALPAVEAEVRRRPPPHAIPLLPDPADPRPPLGVPGSNEQDDTGHLFLRQAVTAAPALLRNFAGVAQTNAIPPDPILAVGPSHVMGLVNRDFAIFTKDGEKLQQIHAPTWFTNVAPGNNAFDPKVIYDHFADRWVMVWLAVNTDTLVQSSHILVSVSDDDDPRGTWCNFALPGNANGSTPVSNWSDYQGLGFDESAVYVTPNQFQFGGGFAGVKLRILPKATLYDPTCPAIVFTDFWELRDPDSSGLVATVRPAVTFGSPGTQYLINDSPFVTGTTLTLWSLNNPLDPIPTLSAVNVSVTVRSPPPNADQLGGSSLLVDVGGPRVRNLVYRDGSVWTAQSVASASGLYTRARYVKIDVAGPTTVEDVSFGRDGCWLYYPAITADLNGNMSMVYNQSCGDEYIGIRYTGRRSGDALLRPSAELKAGEANYVKDFGTGRNRWGDYNGIAVDPADPSRVWMFAEYAASPNNTWGTWFGEISPRSLGDVNADGDVNVGDVVLLVDFILERATPDPESAVVSDCNRDGGLNVGDVVCVVELILGGGSGPMLAVAAGDGGRRTARASLQMGPSAGSAARRTLILGAELASRTAGVQARIRFDPNRVRLAPPELAERARGFDLAMHSIENEMRLLIFDPAGRTLSGGGALVRFPLELVASAGEPEEIAVELVELLTAEPTGAVRRAEVVRTRLAALPNDFRLSSSYPNPLSAGGATKLDLEIPELLGPALSGGGGERLGSVRVVADVYNVRGQRVRRLLELDLPPGRHTLEWDGRNDRGELVGSGLYVLRLRAGGFVTSRKLIVSAN